MKTFFLAIAVAVVTQSGAIGQDYRASADAAIAQNRFEEAIALCGSRLGAEPGDEYCAVTLPRLYSWTHRFEESVAAYDRCIEALPKHTECLVEKARVLGWAKSYAQSMDAYEQAILRADSPDLRRELAVKRALWSARSGAALNAGDGLLRETPANQEILMDLGQLYSNSALHAEAGAYYSKLLSENPYNSAARRAAEKNDVQGKDYLLAAGAAAWRATSTQRDTDVDRLSLFAGLSKNVLDGLNVSATARRSKYRYDPQEALDENYAALGASYRPDLFTGVGLDYGLAGYQGAADPRNSYSFYAWHKFFDSLDISAAYEKENSVINRRNITNGLYSRAARARASYYWSRRLQLGADYKAGSITDGNYFNIQGFDAQYAFTEEPRRLYAMARAESWDYRKGSPNYYAPGWYAIYAFLGGYRHYFNRDFYYGAPQVYAEAQLKYSADSNREPAWQPSARFHADFGNSGFVEGSWSITSSQYYNDTSALFCAGVYF